MRLAVQHGLTPAELAKSLAAVAAAEDLGGEVADLLAKAEPLKLPRERYLHAMVVALEARYLRQVDILAENLKRWLDSVFPWRGDWTIRKARPGIGLTYHQIEELRRLVEAHFRVAGEAGMGWGIPPHVWEEWRAAGIVVPWLPIPEIQDAMVAGRLYQVIRDGDTYEHMRRLADAAPLARPQLIAAAWAEAHAAEKIAGLGQRLAAQAAHQALTVQQQLARGLIVRYLRGELTATAPAPGPPHDLTAEERAALETDRAVESWRGLARELYREFRGTDARRDWLRVAASEVRLASNVGRLQGMEEQEAEEIWYLVQPDACVHCKAIYLEADGRTPKVFKLSEIMANLAKTGGLNVGRKASLIGDPEKGWIPNGGILHPFDRCKPMPKLRGLAPTSLQGGGREARG